MLRAALRSAIATTLYGSGLLNLHRRTVLRDQAVILMYHRVFDVGEVPGDFEPGMYVTTDTFERHLAYLADAYEILDLDALLEWMSGKRRCARTPCSITFDDGWADNYINAFPLLHKVGIPATIFLITGQIGNPDMLTWEQVAEMESAGIRFGSHTVTHRELTILTPGSIEWELSKSRQMLEERIAQPTPWLCYPKGYHNQTARHIASEHYAAAVTTDRRGATKDVNRFMVPRIGVHDDIASSTALFALRLSGLQ